MFQWREALFDFLRYRTRQILQDFFQLIGRQRARKEKEGRKRHQEESDELSKTRMKQMLLSVFLPEFDRECAGRGDCSNEKSPTHSQPCGDGANGPQTLEAHSHLSMSSHLSVGPKITVKSPLF